MLAALEPTQLSWEIACRFISAFFCLSNYLKFCHPCQSWPQQHKSRMALADIGILRVEDWSPPLLSRNKGLSQLCGKWRKGGKWRKDPERKHGVENNQHLSLETLVGPHHWMVFVFFSKMCLYAERSSELISSNLCSWLCWLFQINIFALKYFKTNAVVTNQVNISYKRILFKIQSLWLKTLISHLTKFWDTPRISEEPATNRCWWLAQTERKPVSMKCVACWGGFQPVRDDLCYHPKLLLHPKECFV